MTLDFFYNNYNFDDIDINKIYIKDNKLYIFGIYNVYLELIANGYRPEMNMDLNKTFVFNVNHNDHKFKLPCNVKYNKDGNDYYIMINDLKLDIFGEIEIL